MLIKNAIALSQQIYLNSGKQLNQLSFNSPLHYVLRQHSPLLRLLNQQPKWQFWFVARPMLKRSWLRQAGLDSTKIIQLRQIAPTDMIKLIEKALLAKTASYIVACLDHGLTEHEKYRLQQAVKVSGTHLFLIDDPYLSYEHFMTMSLAVNLN